MQLFKKRNYVEEYFADLGEGPQRKELPRVHAEKGTGQFRRTVAWLDRCGQGHEEKGTGRFAVTDYGKEKEEQVREPTARSPFKQGTGRFPQNEPTASQARDRLILIARRSRRPSQSARSPFSNLFEPPRQAPGGYKQSISIRSPQEHVTTIRAILSPCLIVSTTGVPLPS